MNQPFSQTVSTGYVPGLKFAVIQRRYFCGGKCLTVQPKLVELSGIGFYPGIGWSIYAHMLAETTHDKVLNILESCRSARVAAFFHISEIRRKPGKLGSVDIIRKLRSCFVIDYYNMIPLAIQNIGHPVGASEFKPLVMHREFYRGSCRCTQCLAFDEEEHGAVVPIIL